MQTKIDESFWTHPQIESADAEVRLAALWMLTNGCLQIFGYARVTPRRFAFETGLKQEVLPRALQALPDMFKPLPEGYFIPDYIRRQVGSGDMLLANNICKGLLRALVALRGEPVFTLVLEHYPELERGLKLYGFQKPLPSPTQGERTGTGEGTGTSTGTGTRVEGGVGETSDLAPEPVGQLRERMDRVGQLRRRKPGSAWTGRELESFRLAGLDLCSAEEFAEQLAQMQAYYGAKIPREIDRRRRDLQSLLNNWAVELDRARVHERENDDGVTSV